MKIATKSIVSKEQEDKLFNFRPVFFVAIFLCLGIAFAFCHIAYGVSNWWKILLLLLFIGVAFCRTRRKRIKVLFAVLVLLVSFTCGEAAVSLKIANYQQNSIFDGEHTVAGRVVEKREYSYSTYVLLTDVSVDGKLEKGKFVAYLPASFCKNVHLSDRILTSAKIRTNNDLFDEYGFAAYHIAEDIRYQLYEVEETYVVGHEFDLFLEARERLTSVIENNMSETPATVMIALFTGETQGMDDALLENVRYGGIAHIFAVSGLHIGALYAFSRKLFTKMKAPKWVEFSVLAAVLLFYAGICGFSASVVRAMVICLIAHAAKLLWMQSDFLQSLGAAAIVVLLLNPVGLFEVGFQLSFMACLGLALLTRPIQKLLEKACKGIAKLFTQLFHLDHIARARPTRKKEGDTSPLSIPQRILRACISFLATCLAAQIATAPLQLQTFGYLSGWSLLLNCLFVPIVSGIFAMVLLLTAIACVLPMQIASMLLYVPSVVWTLLMIVFETVDFSTFALMGVQVSGGAMLSYYSGVQFCSDKWNISRKQKWLLVGASFLACALCLIISNTIV